MSVIVAPFPVEVYEQVHWPDLRRTLDALLTVSPEVFKPISYEQVYSTVYKCVCRAYGDRLYQDMTKHIAAHVSVWAQSYCALEGPALAVAFRNHLHQYRFAKEGVTSVFTYLDRFYVRPKLQTDLETSLSAIFMVHLADQVAPRVVDVIRECESTPFLIQPDIRVRVLEWLAKLDTKYVDLATDLFAKYLPNVRPPMLETDLGAQVREDQLYQQKLLQSGFGRGNVAKRAREEENT